jgi:hypothetical protein
MPHRAPTHPRHRNGPYMHAKRERGLCSPGLATVVWTACGRARACDGCSSRCCPEPKPQFLSQRRGRAMAVVVGGEHWQSRASGQRAASATASCPAIADRALLPMRGRVKQQASWLASKPVKRCQASKVICVLASLLVCFAAHGTGQCKVRILASTSDTPILSL